MNKLLGIFKIKSNTGRIYGLDILRAFAIMVVVLGHGNWLLPINTKRRIDYFLPDGVLTFFILSGFLIGGILIKIIETDKISVKTLFHFWRRRWLRTLPLYYFTLIVLILLSGLFISEFNFSETKQFFIFLQNFNKSHSFFFSVSWSLAIEEWFYLLMPFGLFLVINLLGLKPKNALLFVALIVIIFSISYRYYRYLHIVVDTPEVFDIWFRRPVVTRLDSLMLGVIGAYLFYYYRLSWVKKKNTLFVAGLVCYTVIKIITNLFLSTSAFYYCNFSFLLEGFFILMLLPYLSQLKTGNGILYKIISSISLISYSMYLMHAIIVQDWVLRKIPTNSLGYIPGILVKYILYWVITILLSILTYKYIEVPFMELRNKKRIVNFKPVL